MNQEPFPHFTAETVSWLVGIEENNTKEFFASHKAQYLGAVREPFEALLDTLAQEFGGKPFLFRPNRDIRFSKNKSPYKTNISGYLADRPGTASAAYLELSAQGLMAATGYYQMASDQLERYRAVLTAEAARTLGAELNTILAKAAGPGCIVGGEQLKTAPRGIDRNSENIDLLRYKSLTVRASLPLSDVLQSTTALHFVQSTWNAGQDLTRWLDEHVGVSILPDQFR